MKKWLSILLVVILVLSFGIFALGSGESGTDDQGHGKSDGSSDKSNLGDYKVEILSSRLAKDFEGKDVVIVKYKFTNNAKEPISFIIAFQAQAFQDGVGLNESYFVEDGADYNMDDQNKEIKTGASLEVEVAYELNDTTTDVEIEVSELISLSEKKVTKTFSITE